jgi:hypothetical protein
MFLVGELRKIVLSFQSYDCKLNQLVCLKWARLKCDNGFQCESLGYTVLIFQSYDCKLNPPVYLE